MISGSTENLTALLLPLLYCHTKAHDLGPCLLHNINQCQHRLAICKEIIHNQNFFTGIEIRSGHKHIVHLLVRE